MLEQLHAKQQRQQQLQQQQQQQQPQQQLQKSESKAPPQQDQQDEVGYSNYARRGAPKSSLARAGKSSLAKSAMPAASFGRNMSVNQDNGGMRRAKSATTLVTGSNTPHIFYDSNNN